MSLLNQLSDKTEQELRQQVHTEAFNFVLNRLNEKRRKYDYLTDYSSAIQYAIEIAPSSLKYLFIDEDDWIFFPSLKAQYNLGDNTEFSFVILFEKIQKIIIVFCYTDEDFSNEDFFDEFLSRYWDCDEGRNIPFLNVLSGLVQKWFCESLKDNPFTPENDIPEIMEILNKFDRDTFPVFDS